MHKWRSRLRELLGEHPVFMGLDAGVYDALDRAARLRKLRRGQRVWKMGTRPDELAVVLAGTLEVCRGEDEARMVFRVLEPGDVVGYSIVAGQPHTADLRAGSGLHLAVIPGPTVRRQMLEAPDLALRFIAELGNLVGLLTDENAALRKQTLRDRVETWLRRHGRVGDEVRVTHQDLAAEVAASRARVTDVLGSLKREGRVALGRGRIRLLRAG